jgi:hypothetical protein
MEVSAGQRGDFWHPGLLPRPLRMNTDRQLLGPVFREAAGQAVGRRGGSLIRKGHGGSDLSWLWPEPVFNSVKIILHPS